MSEATTFACDPGGHRDAPGNAMVHLSDLPSGDYDNRSSSISRYQRSRACWSDPSSN